MSDKISDSPTFRKTWAKVLADRYYDERWSLLVGLFLGILWIFWFCFSRVTLYEISSDSRIESLQQNFLIEPQVSGKLESYQLFAGKECIQGKVIAEIESKFEQLALRETEAQLKEAQITYHLVDEELRRLKPLKKVGYTTEMDYLRADATRSKAMSGIEALSATVEKLQFEIERRKIRCPITGPVAECSVNLKPGMLIAAGDRLGSIVPSGALQGVALFSPGIGLGKIRLGQNVGFRLQAFPWTEYGTLHGQVTSVATEVRDGTVRVEFSLNQVENFAVPLRHGYPGTAEIEVDRVSPLRVILKTAGALSLTRVSQKETP